MMANALSLLEFIHVCENLKKETRKGWLRSGISEPESVADHSWRVGMICLTVSTLQESPLGLDVGKMIKMALIHDLAEAATGDIIPGDGISREQKLDMERKAIEDILSEVDHTGELLGLWEEYNAGETAEARTVQAIDKLEMAIQAVEYTRSGTGGLEEFYEFQPDEFPEGAIRDLFLTLKSGPG